MPVLPCVCAGDVIRIGIHVIRLVQSACLILYTSTYRDIKKQIGRQNGSGSRTLDAKITHHSWIYISSRDDYCNPCYLMTATR